MSSQIKTRFFDYRLSLLVAIIVLYIIGYFFPSTCWAFNSLLMLPFDIAAGLFILCMLFSVSYFRFKDSDLLAKLQQRKIPNLPIAFICSIVAAYVFYNYAIYIDLYGDSERFRNLLGARTIELLPLHLDNLFSFNLFHPKNGERTWLNLVQVISYYSGTSHKAIFTGMSAISGSLFIFTWVYYMSKELGSTKNVVIGILILVGCSCLQNFFGHEEIYAPSLVLFTWYLILWKSYNKAVNPWNRILFPVMLVLCIKSHSIFFLLVPTFLATLWLKFGRDQGLTWKWILSRLVGPIFIAGLVIYFIVFKDHKDPMTLSTETGYMDRLFLPLFGGIPPQDKYFLFSLSHLSDFLNVILSWSPLMVIPLLRISSRKPNLALDNLYKLFLVTGLFFVLFYFAVNPLLSMTRDWDLYGLITPLLLMITMKWLKEDNQLYKYIGPFIGITILICSRHIVNHNSFALGKHYESIGSHIAKTYWATGSGMIILGAKLQELESESFEQRIKYHIDQLQPIANEGNDLEYANLNMELAKYYRTNNRNLDLAEEYHLVAYSYGPKIGANLIGLLETKFLLKKYAEAFVYSEVLLEIEYPSLEKAYSIAIQCALEAEKYEEAFALCSTYLQKIGPDEVIEQVHRSLDSKAQVDSLKYLFQRSSN